MKKLLIIFLISVVATCSFAATTSKSTSVLTDEQLKIMNNTVDIITQKMYSGTFLSPSDTSNLIGIKIKLDDSMLVSPDLRYAQLYFKLGKIYQARKQNFEAIECYKTIIENFSTTSLAQKSAYQLRQLGVNIVIPVTQNDTEED